MTVSGAIGQFEKSVLKANEWLADLSEELEWEDEAKTYRALRAVLHALRDRLTTEESAHLAAQLPSLIRGIYFEGWQPSKPLRLRHREEFLERVAGELLSSDETETEAAVRAAFRVLSKRISSGEIDDVKTMLPKDLRSLWP